MKKSSFYIILIVGIFPSISFSAPSVYGTSGNITDGSSVVVSGNAFTTKTRQTPWIWMNFEAQAVGTQMKSIASGGNAGFLNHAEVEGFGSVAQAVVGTAGAWSGTHSMIETPGANGNQWNSYYNSTKMNSLDVYYSYMWRFNGSSSFSGCVSKLPRMTSGTEYNGIPAFTPQSVNGAGDITDIYFFIQSPSGCYVTPSNTCTSTEEYSHSAALARNTWHRVEGWWKGSVPAGTANGQARWWMDRSLLFTRSNVTTLASADSGKAMDYLLFPLALANGPPSCTTNVVWWLDDVYFDTSGPARVEICNANTWAGSNHCEIQPYTAWSNTSATISVNRGQFGPSASAWLYVIDGTNTPTAAPLAVTFGGGTPAQFPAATTIQEVR